MARLVFAGVLIALAIGCDKDPSAERSGAKPAKADPRTDPWKIVLRFSGGKPPGMTAATMLDSQGRFSSETHSGDQVSSCTATVEKAALRSLEDRLRLDYEAWPSQILHSEKDELLPRDGHSDTFRIGGRAYEIPSSAKRDELSRVFELAQANCH